MIVADTRIAKDLENPVKTEWGGYAYLSSFDSQSRGVAIFMQKQLPVKVLDTFSYINGNILSLLIEIESKQINYKMIIIKNHLTELAFRHENKFHCELDVIVHFLIF